MTDDFQIHQNLPISKVNSANFQNYYKGDGNEGNIKDRIIPDYTNETLILMGCGNREKDVLDLAIVVKANLLFNQTDYKYNGDDNATPIGENSFVYFSKTEDEPIGFSNVRPIFLYPTDVYDEYYLLSILSYTYIDFLSPFRLCAWTSNFTFSYFRKIFVFRFRIFFITKMRKKDGMEH